MKLGLAVALVAIATMACNEKDAAVASASTSVVVDAALQGPGYVVDSALPPEKTLRRFRVGLDPVTRFDDGATRSRNALVQRFARAVAKGDTAALRGMSLSRAEFAYLYFPSTQYMRPPYMTPPDVLWQLMHARSESGMSRLVARVGGAEIRVAGYDCEPTPELEGVNRLYERCTVRYRPARADSVERRRLFGSIIEREGRYKFVSYANDF
jgi:hypothetical protein